MPGVVLLAAPETGIDALTRIFAGLPSTLAAAFIVIVPGYQGSVGKLSEIIGQASGLKTKVVEGGDRIEPRIIHILPSDRLSTLKKSKFLVEAKRGMQKGLVDSFLLSLAADQDEKAIGIILAGLNGDGTLGLTALKESGGLAVAELIDGIDPNAANPTGIVDYLLPREQIVERLTSHLAHRADVVERQAS